MSETDPLVKDLAQQQNNGSGQVVIKNIEFVRDADRLFKTMTLAGLVTLEQLIGELISNKATYQILGGPIYDSTPGVNATVLYVFAQIHTNTPVARHFIEAKEDDQQIPT